MPFDGVFLRAVAGEIREAAVGCRVDRVHQPERDTVILQLRGRQGVLRLLLCAGPNHPRAHFTQAPTENPAQPPMFCMLLRKHLVGGRITDVRQPGLERLLDFTLECSDEMGERTERHLIAELMGRNSNLILCGEDGRIVDCLRRVDFEMSERRQVLPGLFYREPPAQGKRDPLTQDREGLERLVRAESGEKRLDQWLGETFLSLPPLICRELALEFSGETDGPLGPCDPGALAAYLSGEFTKFENGPWEATMVFDAERPRDFSYRPIRQYEGVYTSKAYPSFSELLDAFYAQRDRAEQMRQKTQGMRKTVGNLRDRTARKLAAQRQELAATHDREQLRRMGDIVTANLHRIQRGQPRLTAVDFYDPEMKEIDIPLRPELSPQQNAARLYKEYNKAKNAEKMLTGLIAKGEAELLYLESILEELSRVEGEQDAAEIRAELTEGGYLRQTDRRKGMKPKPSRPMVFRSSEGLTIYVGRNNRQNDQLTMKAADKRDVWLHTQKIHGSHVIIACGGGAAPGERTLDEAAKLAAYYSQAREGQNVPVDYTAVKNVKKPAGAKPGMVIYDHYQTRYVTPEAGLAERLREEG